MSKAPLQGAPTLGSLPSTLEQALQPSDESRVITEPNEPFRIVHVNDVWCRVCGFDAEEALGQTCRILQGFGTCRATLGMLRQALLLKRNFAVQLLNYTKQGRPFMNTLQVTPLFNNEHQVTHYLGVVIARFLDGGGAVPPAVQSLSHPAPQPAPTRIVTAAALRDSNSGSDCASSTALEDALDVTQPSDIDPSDGAGSNAGRVPPFLTKLSEILTSEPAEIVTFNPEAASFTILDASKFAKEVLPRYFKHNKLGSFSQQLHTYGFRRRANPSSHDSAIEFYHNQYSGEAGDFVIWIRTGGALSKRTTHVRESPSSPPPQLMQDMLQVQEGVRQLAMMFAQAKATHGAQLRSILMKLLLRGMLPAESISYLSALPPATALLSVNNQQPSYALPSRTGSNPSVNSWDQAAVSTSTGRCLSVEGLQAQLDALEAGLYPLSSQPFPAGINDPADLHAEEALQMFVDGATAMRLPPYPVDQLM